MSEIKTIKKADNFTTVDFGKLNELSNYVLELGPDMRIPGKVFGGKAVNATGGEFSFQCFQPNTETGFLHSHKNHEELYFFFKRERRISSRRQHLTYTGRKCRKSGS